MIFKARVNSVMTDAEGKIAAYYYPFSPLNYVRSGVCQHDSRARYSKVACFCKLV